ncbi:MAG: 2TM domain-containing protein [Anaerolineae bacterium]|nr:2TM domain-containing protein [Anaerolineae bacterium]
MSEPQLDYQAIQKRVRERVNKRKELYMHAGVYVTVNAIIFLVWLVLRSMPVNALGAEFSDVMQTMRDFPIPLVVVVGWGIGLAIHAMVAYMETNVFDGMQEREMEREIERERARYYATEKPKRSEEMRLSDDGEIVPADEDQAEADREPLARRRAR